MKVLVLTLLLACLMSTMAVQMRYKKSHSKQGLSPDEVLQELDILINNEDANVAFWEDFFSKYDIDGEEGLSKAEFHAGINAWTTQHGFGAQSKPGTDAIWDDLNEDENDVLSFDEALEGSKSIFEWYAAILHNAVRESKPQEAKARGWNECQDVKATLKGFLDYPDVVSYIAESWDTNKNGAVSKEEALHGNDVLRTMLHLKGLREGEEAQLYDEVSGGDDEISYEDAAEFSSNYAQAVLANACRGGSFLSKKSHAKQGLSPDEVLQELDILINNEDANVAFWEDFFSKYDVDGEEGLSKAEFHAGINAWTTQHGFGAQSKPGTDAIWDDLNEDENDVLSFDEALEGSKSIFEWYAAILHNAVRESKPQEAKARGWNECQDVKATLKGFLDYPDVVSYIAESWDTNKNGAVSKEEALHGNDVLRTMLHLKGLREGEEAQLYDEVSGGDDEISYEDAAEFSSNYAQAVLANACH